MSLPDITGIHKRQFESDPQDVDVLEGEEYHFRDTGRFILPPVPIPYRATRRVLTLEQRGILLDALFWTWHSPEVALDHEKLRRLIYVNPRKWRRLWTGDLIEAYEECRRVRRPVDPRDRKAVWDASKGVCQNMACKQRLTLKPGLPNSFHVDHVIPVCKGGISHLSNLQALCRTCNLTKPKEYFVAPDAEPVS
jgi:5-methylcytosine-specific restriction endonuclease McrA